jgi:hypothetical protein
MRVFFILFLESVREREMAMQSELYRIQKERDDEVSLLQQRIEILEANAQGSLQVEYNDGLLHPRSTSSLAYNEQDFKNESEMRRKSSHFVGKLSMIEKSSQKLPRKSSLKSNHALNAEPLKSEALFKNRNQKRIPKSPKFKSAPFNLSVTFTE